MPGPDPLAAELTAICDRAEEMRSRDVWVRVKAAEADRDRLRGALGEVLKRHQPKAVTVRELCVAHQDAARRRLLRPDELERCTGCNPECPDDNLWEKCPERAAITAELLSKEDGHDG